MSEYDPTDGAQSELTSSAQSAPGASEGAGPLTPADAADAARLVAFGLQPKLLPARDVEYAELLR
ncbi:hypothetical protein AB4Z54_69825, partial [Streptomyces sp. MCAF7]